MNCLALAYQVKDKRDFRRHNLFNEKSNDEWIIILFFINKFQVSNG